jgi:hypothetical protein
MDNCILIIRSFNPCQKILGYKNIFINLDENIFYVQKVNNLGNIVSIAPCEFSLENKNNVLKDLLGHLEQTGYCLLKEVNNEYYDFVKKNYNGEIIHIN